MLSPSHRGTISRDYLIKPIRIVVLFSVNIFRVLFLSALVFTLGESLFDEIFVLLCESFWLHLLGFHSRLVHLTLLCFFLQPGLLVHVTGLSVLLNLLCQFLSLSLECIPFIERLRHLIVFSLLRPKARFSVLFLLDFVLSAESGLIILIRVNMTLENLPLLPFDFWPLYRSTIFRLFL